MSIGGQFLIPLLQPPVSPTFISLSDLTILGIGYEWDPTIGGFWGQAAFVGQKERRGSARTQGDPGAQPSSPTPGQCAV